MYAHKNKWIVVNVPDCRKWTHERKKVTRFYNGLYLQNEAAVQWLDQFLRANDVILNEKPVDMQLLGKYDITGIHDDEYEPVPNLYYEDRNTYFDEISVKYS